MLSLQQDTSTAEMPLFWFWNCIRLHSVLGIPLAWPHVHTIFPSMAPCSFYGEDRDLTDVLLDLEAPPDPCPDPSLARPWCRVQSTQGKHTYNVQWLFYAYNLHWPDSCTEYNLTLFLQQRTHFFPPLIGVLIFISTRGLTVSFSVHW